MASYLRTFEWGGPTISLLHQQRMAIVSSLAPWHQSARVGLMAHSTFVEILRIDARAPLPSIVEQLNSFQPSCLVGYADMVRVLAGEQGEGRLRIAPSAIYCVSEPLRQQARAAIGSVWGVQACNVYAATETAGIASQCEFRTGLHLYEDLIIPEVLDDDYHPVPVGKFGSRLVVTVLFSRTIPLIRYELSDSVAMSADPCPCGRPFSMLKDVQGRQEDMLQVPDAHGHPIMIHPNLFHGVMEGFPLKQWQIVQEPGGLRVLIQAEANGQLVFHLRTTIATALSMTGATVQGIEIERVQEIQKTAIGKRKLIVAMSQSSASA